MSEPAILVIDGNRAATRAQQVAAGGQPSGEGYAQVLQSLAAVRCDIVRPADGEVRFPSGAGGVAGCCWVRERARSTMPSNMGMRESAGSG